MITTNGGSKLNFSLIKRFINKITDDDIFALSAQFSYYIILGIFPFVFLFVIFMGYYSNSLFDILYGIKNLIPKEIYNLLLNIVTDSVNNYKSPYFSASIIVLLWSASSGSIGIIKGINKAYDCEIKLFFYENIRTIVHISSYDVFSNCFCIHCYW